MKQRQESLYCAKNGKRQRRKVGAKNILTEELTGVTCREKKKKNQCSPNEEILPSHLFNVSDVLKWICMKR